MSAPPTCSCGAILVGFERSKELNIGLYFCPWCRAREEEVARLKAKEVVVPAEAMPKAA